MSRKIFTFFKQCLQKYSLKESNPDLNTCIACGSCTATCTAGHFTEMSFRRILLMLQRGKEDEAKKMIQRCMLCGKCTLVCPRGINIRKILLDITR